jgi:hypothetical protein
VAESTVRWFVVREKRCWMATDSANMLEPGDGLSGSGKQLQVKHFCIWA